MTDLSMRGSIYASSSNYDEDESPAQKTPNKLVKRKSLGPVQLNKGLGPNIPASASGSAEKDKTWGKESNRESSLDIPKSKRPMSMQGHRLPSAVRQAATQRHASYGTPKTKPDASTDDLHEDVRDRKRSTSRGARPNVRDVAQEENKKNEREREREREKEKEEGHRGFMGNMRRLSLVGRHKRTKSGASLANMEVLASIPSEKSTAPAPPADSNPEEPPSLPPLPSLSNINISRPRTPHTPSSSMPTLLPPIELQPPSPPRNNTNTKNTTESINTLINTGTDSMLSPLSSNSSVPPPSTSTSGSSSSFPLPSIPKSPESLRSPTTPKTPKSPASPQAASLGRSTISPKHAVTNLDVQRRNSLSDLKIPPRISQAQFGLKRDLGMVRDFAVYIERA